MTGEVPERRHSTPRKRQGEGRTRATDDRVREDPVAPLPVAHVPEALVDVTHTLEVPAPVVVGPRGTRRWTSPASVTAAEPARETHGPAVPPRAGTTGRRRGSVQTWGGARRTSPEPYTVGHLHRLPV